MTCRRLGVSFPFAPALAALPRAQKVVKGTEGNIEINPSLMSLFKMLMYMTYIAHILGCMWHWLATFEEDSINWVSYFGIADVRFPLPHRSIEPIELGDAREKPGCCSARLSMMTRSASLSDGHGDASVGRPPSGRPSLPSRFNRLTAAKEVVLSPV